MEDEQDLEYVRILKEEYQEYGQLNRLFNLSGDLLCIAGFDGFFRKVNPAVIKLLGYTEEELLSRPINDFVFSEDKNVTINSRNTVHKGTPLLHFENRYLTKEGEIVWLSWTSMPDVEDGFVFAVAKNVTEKKLHEEERRIFTDNLTKINEDLQQYTRMTSHDIRSPVTNLLSIFSLLDVSKITDPETQELVGLLKKTSERLHETVNNFVDVLIKNDKLDPVVEELNLTTCLRTVKSSIASLIRDSATIITADCTAFKSISFNKAYLESIFLNLITNAIKYAHPDRLPVIKIFTAINNGIYQLIIQDNGQGFEMDKVQDKIFGLYEVFHQDKGGKGIGLYLVHTHVTAMGGEISVESQLNEGTTFTISFKSQ